MLLAARIVGSGYADVAQMLSVPVFIVVVSLTMMLAGRLKSNAVDPLRPLLLLQLLLLVGFLALCAVPGPRIAPTSTLGIVAGMFGVAAMAVQNALVQISFQGAPSTAVMTTNVTRFALAVGEMLLGGDPARVAAARSRAARILPVIVGFVAGCGLGAACEVTVGLWSLALPVVLAAVAWALGGERT